MDRTWTLSCGLSDCGHPPAAHLATPELGSYDGEPVLWCSHCLRHETVHRSPFRRLFGRRHAPPVGGS